MAYIAVKRRMVGCPVAQMSRLWLNTGGREGKFLLDYKPEFAVIAGLNEQKEARLYGLKGISWSLSDAMQRDLPVQFETVLLPFKDKIIYDSFMNIIPIFFTEGAKKVFREMYENALKRGIMAGLG